MVKRPSNVNEYVTTSSNPGGVVSLGEDLSGNSDSRIVRRTGLIFDIADNSLPRVMSQYVSDLNQGADVAAVACEYVSEANQDAHSRSQSSEGSNELEHGGFYRDIAPAQLSASLPEIPHLQHIRSEVLLALIRCWSDAVEVD